MICVRYWPIATREFETSNLKTDSEVSTIDTLVPRAIKDTVCVIAKSVNCINVDKHYTSNI